MGTISARVPDDLEDDLEEYIESERLDRSTAIRKLLAEGLSEWRRRYALDLLEDGEVTLSRAAEIAEMDIWTFANVAQEHDVTWVSGDHAADDLADL